MQPSRGTRKVPTCRRHMSASSLLSQPQHTLDNNNQVPHTRLPPASGTGPPPSSAAPAPGARCSMAGERGIRGGSSDVLGTAAREHGQCRSRARRQHGQCRSGARQGHAGLQAQHTARAQQGLCGTALHGAATRVSRAQPVPPAAADPCLTAPARSASPACSAAEGRGDSNTSFNINPNATPVA